MKFQKYLIKLSNKAEIKIDEDEVEIVMAGIQSGNPVRVRQGIFNPSFFVALVIDEERYNEWKSDNAYRGGPGQPTLNNSKLIPLRDIFHEILPLPNGSRSKDRSLFGNIPSSRTQITKG